MTSTEYLVCGTLQLRDLGMARDYQGTNCDLIPLIPVLTTIHQYQVSTERGHESSRQGRMQFYYKTLLLAIFGHVRI